MSEALRMLSELLKAVVNEAKAGAGWSLRAVAAVLLEQRRNDQAGAPAANTAAAVQRLDDKGTTPADAKLEQPESAALGAALQAAAVLDGADDVGEFVHTHHDAPVSCVVQPDEAAAPLYAEALARHDARGTALFGGEGH